MSERNVPEVRFRGFCGEWEKTKVANITSFHKQGFYTTEEYHYSKKYYLLRGTDLSNNKLILKNTPKIDASEKDFKDFKIQTDDFLIVRSGTVGTYGIVEKEIEAIFGSYLINFRFDKKQVVNDFFGCFYQSDLFKRQLNQIIQQSANTNINAENIKSVSISLPKVDEQTKIGEFFKNLDNLIAQNQKKYDKLVNMKKACLDKMFPKDGADTPEVRSKGFSGKWELCKIKDICSISTGKSNTQDRIENGKYPFYVRSSIVEQSNRYLFDEESVLTVGDGVGTGKVFHYVNGKYDLHQRVYRMFDFDVGIISKYFYYYFSIFFYNRVMSMTAKTYVDSVRLEMISEMDFIYPSKKEQQKLLDYLDNIDHLITLRKTELEKLKNIKKACLDKMFI